MLTNTLKKIRNDHHITQLDLADAVLTTRQTIHAIESGKSAPSLELALRLGQFFHLAVEDIFLLKLPKKTGGEDLEPFSLF